MPKSKLSLLHVAGARPNFMKIAPVMRAVARHPDRLEQALVHTGQHYDDNMSRVFFEQLGLPKPDLNLEVGSGSHAVQTARIMEKFEPIVLSRRPDWVVVVGDVNSTIACALVCAKLGVRVAHVEAGLRSGDRTMPEEINRVLTDQISDLLFTPSRDGDENLLREGVEAAKIHFVGNVMIDTLLRLLPSAEEAFFKLLASHEGLANRLGGKPKSSSAGSTAPYLLVTLHRPSNVDDVDTLGEIMSVVGELAGRMPVVFPVHPRTRARLKALGWAPPSSAAEQNLLLVDPVGYLEFVGLQRHAALVLTDSGGIQEETTVLGVPCLTARPNTERPVTITSGTNQLVESNREALLEAVDLTLSCPQPEVRVPELWDGRAAERITEVFLQQ